MIVTALTLSRVRNLFASAILCGIYSLLGATAYVVMDAVDVAFTEAAVGAGLSTVLMLGTLALTTEKEIVTPKEKKLSATFLVIITGSILIYGTLDLPFYGDPTAPVHTYVASHYITNSAQEIGLPNMVTSVLASYRGYDTLGEVFVILTAAVGVISIIGRRGAAAGDREA